MLVPWLIFPSKHAMTLKFYQVIWTLRSFLGIQIFVTLLILFSVLYLYVWRKRSLTCSCTLLLVDCSSNIMEEQQLVADERIREDLATLQSSNNEESTINKTDLLRLTDIVLSFLISPATFDIQTQLNSFAEETPMINASVIKSSTRGLILFYQECMKEGMSVTQIHARCSELVLDIILSEAIVETWNRKTVKVAASLVSRTITANKLIDMDWSFGVTAGSSDALQVGKTYLQLRLTIDEQSRGIRVYFVELSVEQFYSFLASLEAAKQYLDFVASSLTQS